MFGFLSRVDTHQAVNSTCPHKLTEWQHQEEVTFLVWGGGGFDCKMCCSEGMS